MSSAEDQLILDRFEASEMEYLNGCTVSKRV